MTTKRCDTVQTVTRIVSIRSKDNVTQNKDHKIKLSKNLKRIEMTGMGRQKFTTYKKR